MTARNVFLGTLVVLATLVGAYLVIRLIQIIIFLVIAFIFASALAPFVNRLNRRLPLGLSVALVYLALIMVVMILLTIILQPAVAQVVTLLQDTDKLFADVERQVTDLQSYLTTEYGVPEDVLLSPDLQGFFTDLLQRAPALAAGVLNVTLGFVSAIAGVLIILVIGFYWLLERRDIEARWLSLVPHRHRPEARQIIEEIEDKAGGYVRGVITLATIMSILSFAGLWLLGIRDYALVLALLVGVAEFIPLLGPFLAAVPALIVAFATSPLTAVAVAALYLILQQIENNFLAPKVMQRSVGLSPLSVLVAVLAGATLLGIIGALLSVPIASAVDIILKHTVFRKDNYPDQGEGKGERPRSIRRPRDDAAVVGSRPLGGTPAET